jgi:uncharacterized protein YndB with AHSA1/START domain
MSADHTKTLRFNRHFQAAREKIFRAWTDPKQLMKWWGPKGFTTPIAEVDLRENGRYRIAMQPQEGPVRYLSGVYIEVKPPKRLVMTWSFEGTPRHDGHESRLTLAFIAHGGASTELILTHERLPEPSLGDFDMGWKSTLEKFEEYMHTLSVQVHAQG